MSCSSACSPATATADDVRERLPAATTAALVVVTAQDGAWANDPFAASPLYELVESSAHGGGASTYPGRSRQPAADREHPAYRPLNQLKPRSSQ